MPNAKLVFTGSRSQVGAELTSRRQISKGNELAIYDDAGRLCSSTLGGGASPHAWDTRASGKSRKFSGLTAWKKA